MKLWLEDKEIEVPAGTTLKQLADEHASEYPNDVIMAKVDGVVQEFYHLAEEGTHVRLCTISDNDGMRVYERGVTMLVLKAIHDILPPDRVENVKVEFTLYTGHFCHIIGNVDLDQELINLIEEKMREYVEQDIPFQKRVIRTRDAKELFGFLNMDSKVSLTKYRRNSRMTVYELGDYTDYYFGAMPYSTGVLKHFSLRLYMDGFVFVLPSKNEPEKVQKFDVSKMFFYTMQYTNDWIEMMGVSNVGELNDVIVRGEFTELMSTQEALHEKKIGDIAEEIVKRKAHIVTIAGPSSSGKTTFSYRLSTQLKTLGVNPHPIGLDDYFVNREDTPKDENGKYNFECIEAIDTKQFQDDMKGLLAGKEIQLPTYNFITGMRQYDKPVMQIGEDDILVIEGIHGLNDKLTEGIPENEKYKIYISALTTLNLDDHNRIPTTDGRLIRRIIRDARTRGNTAQRTISMWDSVRRGEEQNIFPFQERADVIFNSALIYELAAMKLYADPVLFQVPQDSEEYSEAQRLLKFLDYFLPVDPHHVPLNSVLREFIGGGILLG
ncbi:MAG: nucleoside kinase [Eubacterium sp.]|nr:nucleoside kinase [Eubacterium sp.]